MLVLPYAYLSDCAYHFWIDDDKNFRSFYGHFYCFKESAFVVCKTNNSCDYNSFLPPSPTILCITKDCMETSGVNLPICLTFLLGLIGWTLALIRKQKCWKTLSGCSQLKRKKLPSHQQISSCEDSKYISDQEEELED